VEVDGEGLATKAGVLKLTGATLYPLSLMSPGEDSKQNQDQILMYTARMEQISVQHHRTTFEQKEMSGTRGVVVQRAIVVLPGWV
jgi:hypothetical protein